LSQWCVSLTCVIVLIRLLILDRHFQTREPPCLRCRGHVTRSRLSWSCLRTVYDWSAGHTWQEYTPLIGSRSIFRSVVRGGWFSIQRWPITRLLSVTWPTLTNEKAAGWLSVLLCILSTWLNNLTHLRKHFLRTPICSGIRLAWFNFGPGINSVVSSLADIKCAKTRVVYGSGQALSRSLSIGWRDWVPLQLEILVTARALWEFNFGSVNVLLTSTTTTTTTVSHLDFHLAKLK